MNVYNEMKCERAFNLIEKIKSNLVLSNKEIQQIDDFFCEQKNQMFLNTILSNNVNFDLSLLEKTIYSTFVNNFNLFRIICNKGVNPIIYAGYSNKKEAHCENNYIIVNNKLVPFIWIKKENLKTIINYLHITKFNLNLYYSTEGIINLNDLSKLKLYSNLILVGNKNDSFINLNNFSNQILNQDELKKILV